MRGTDLARLVESEVITARVLRALVSHAIATTVPTPWRLREARRRLRAAGVRLADYRQKPTFAPGPWRS